MKIFIASILASALCFTGCSDDDDGGGDTTYTLALTNAQETPACPAEAAATGTGMITVNDTTITVTALTATGLTSAPTAAHIHVGAMGAAGGVAIAFTGLTLPFTASYTATNFTAVAGGPQTFAELVTAIKAGGTYVNIHNAACAGGAIRDQIN